MAGGQHTAGPGTATGGEPLYFGVLAEFENPATIYHACEQVRDAGFTRWDSHTPFAVHGLDKAMGLGPTHVSWAVFIGAMLGMVAGTVLQWWVASVAYPLVIAAKPFFSWQAFVPVTFELSILGGAAGALFGLLGFCQLPRHHHSLFNSERFERSTDDKFFISIEVRDPKFDPEETQSFLKKVGATHVEMVEA